MLVRVSESDGYTKLGTIARAGTLGARTRPENRCASRPQSEAYTVCVVRRGTCAAAAVASCRRRRESARTAPVDRVARFYERSSSSSRPVLFRRARRRLSPRCTAFLSVVVATNYCRCCKHKRVALRVYST